MRKGFLGALAGLLTSVGSIFSQVPSGDVPAAVPIQGGAVAGQDSGAVAIPSEASEPSTGTGFWGARVWGGTELLLWTVKPAPLPVPLLTQGDQAASEAAAQPVGALGSPGTTILNPGNFSFGTTPGVRLTLGGWLECDRRFGLEANFFVLPQQTSRFSYATGPATGTQALAVPFLDVTNNQEQAIQLTFPFDQPGATQARVEIRNQLSLWGADLNGQFRLYQNSWFTCGVVGGFRYLDLAESMQFNVLVNNGAVTGLLAPLANTFFTFTDQFGTRNQFFGPELGGHAEFYVDHFFLNVTGQLGLGPMHQSVNINGLSGNNFSFATALPTSSTQTTPTGIFAQSTNSGQHAQDVFAVVPEIKLQLGIEFWQRLRVFGGYSFLYASSVLRPGNQIDRGLNINNLAQNFAFSSAIPLSLTTPYRPMLSFNTSSFWAEGVSIGVELKY